MNQTLEQLIKLQEIDHRLLEIKDYMGDLPSTVETQGKEVKTLKSENEEKLNRILDIEKEMRHYEREIESMNTQMLKYKEQLYLVKSNKEYDSLNHEIDHIKTNISESETELLNLIEEKDTNTMRDMKEDIIYEYSDLQHYPIKFISIKKGKECMIIQLFHLLI